MGKFNVGDRVQIRPDLKIDRDRTGPIINSEMVPHAGELHTISHVNSRDCYSLDGVHWNWPEDTLLFVSLPELVTGMVVRLRDGRKAVVMRDTAHGDIMAGPGFSCHFSNYDLDSGKRNDEMLGRDIVEVLSPRVSSDIIIAREGGNARHLDSIWKEPLDTLEMTMEELNAEASKIKGRPINIKIIEG